MSVQSSAVSKIFPMGESLGGGLAPIGYFVGYGGMTGDGTAGHALTSWSLPVSYAFKVEYISQLYSGVSGATIAQGYGHLTTGVDAQSSHNEQIIIQIPSPGSDGAQQGQSFSATDRSGGYAPGPKIIFNPDDGESASPTLSIYSRNVNTATIIHCCRVMLFDPDAVRHANLDQLWPFLT